MYCIHEVNENTFWIGSSDRRLELFENVFPIPNGISYNSYFIDDKETVLLDTVDYNVSLVFKENLDKVLNGRVLDYLVINHMEPDHCSLIKELTEKFPKLILIGNAKTESLINQFFQNINKENIKIVKDGDTLSTGKHELVFQMAPMVHWPETMVTYDKKTKCLFSGDAFGTFGAINGNLFSDEISFKRDWLPDARRYYTNIVGKYGAQVQALLGKLKNIEVEMICPLHGPIIRENIEQYIGKYDLWSKYESEYDSVVIAYASVYGGTENIANILALKLAERKIKHIKMFDVSKTHPSYILSEIFANSHLVIASTTYNNGIFCNMETLLSDMMAHGVQNKTVAVIENGSWAPVAGKLVREEISKMKNMTLLDLAVTIKSTMLPEQMELIDALADRIVESIKI